MILDNGRICLKTAGREAGKYCVVVDKVDDGFVLVTGPKSVTGIKRRKCNILHLEPTKERFEIESKTDDSRIEDMWKKSNLIEKFNIQILVKREHKKEEKVKKSPKKEIKGE